MNDSMEDKLNDEFMNAVENDEDYVLRWPVNSQINEVLEEEFWLKRPIVPRFTPGTLPSWPPGFWYSTSTTDNTNPQDVFK